MMNRLLALGCALASSVAFGDVNTCSLRNNKSLETQFQNRSFDGFFKSNGNEIKTRVTFYGNRGEFKREGQGSPDYLNCLRYLTIDEAFNLSQELNAEGIDVTAYFDTSSCGAAILADWSTSNGSGRGRVLWCAPLYSSGAQVQGIYWQDLNWELNKFTDIWEGRWQ